MKTLKNIKNIFLNIKHQNIFLFLKTIGFSTPGDKPDPQLVNFGVSQRVVTSQSTHNRYLDTRTHN